MKKLLALVLALVMTLGLATVSTSAAYSDQADINYDEAVDVMTAIGIFEGKSGAFDPKANLNRAEAAKVVAYLMLGNSTAENLKGIGTKFTDVPASHWAAGYIEYLASVGIVSGVGDNKFDPNGQVTGIQLAKMLLVALGYDAKIEGFVGPDWAINIQSIANKVGIYDGNDSIVGTAPVSRDEAALYAFNTIKSPLVEYDNTTTVNVSGATVTVGGNKAKYVVNNSTAKQTIDDAMEVNTNNYLVEFAEQYYKDLKLVLNDKVDDFGRPANTWTYKNEEIGTYVDFTEQVGAAYTAKVTQKMLYELLGKGVYDSLVAGRTTLTVYQDGVVTNVSRNDIDDYVNSENTGAVNSTGNGSETQVFMDDDDNVIVVTRHPYVFQASSDYNTTDKTLTLKPAGDTDYAGVAKNIVGSNLKLKNIDFDEALTEYKADDYIIAFVYSTNHKAYDNGGNFKISEVSKAATLEGTVSSYKVDGEVVLDGTTYKYSKMTQKDSEHAAGNNDPVQGTQYTVGQKAIVVLDQTGKYVIAVDEAIVSSNYVFVADIAGTSTLKGKATAKLYFTDGTDDEAIIKKLRDLDSAKKIIGDNQVAAAKIGSMTGVDNGGPSENAGWYLYSKDSSGQYTLYSIPTTYKQADYIYTAATVGTASPKIVTSGQVKFLTATAFGTSTEGVAGTAENKSASFEAANDSTTTPQTIRANDKTIFIIDDNGDTLVYEGIKNVPDISLKENATKPGKAFVSVAMKDDYAKYVYITLDGTYDVDSEGKALLYVVSYDGQFVTDDNDRYFQFKVLDGKEEVTVKADSNLGKNTLTDSYYTAYYKVHKNADDEYTGLDLINKTGAGTVDSPYYDGKYFSISGVTGTDAKGNLKQLGENDGALEIGKQSYTLADGYKIYLITPKAYTNQAGVAVAGSAVMNGDTKADYKVDIVTAKQLVDRLDNYNNVTFNIQGRTDDDWNESAKKLVEAYITVTRAENDVATAATPTVTPASGSDTTRNVNIGASLVLRVSATATNGTLSYQWQSKVGAGAWINISGETGATHQVDTSANGITQYRCVVTNTLDRSTATATSGTTTVNVGTGANAAKVDNVYVTVDNVMADATDYVKGTATAAFTNPYVVSWADDATDLKINADVTGSASATSTAAAANPVGTTESTYTLGTALSRDITDGYVYLFKISAGNDVANNITGSDSVYLAVKVVKSSDASVDHVYIKAEGDSLRDITYYAEEDINAAIASPYTVSYGDTNFKINASGTGTIRAEKNETAAATVAASDVTGHAYTLDSNVTRNVTDKYYYVFKITATAENNTNKDVVWVAVQVLKNSTVTLGTVKVDGNGVMVYATEGEARANPVVKDWAADGTYPVEATPAEATSTAKIGDTDLATGTINKNPEATTLVTVTFTAEDTTTKTTGYVAVQVKKTIALGTAPTISLSQGNDSLGVEQATLVAANTCETPDLNGTLTMRLFKAANNVMAVQKVITFSNGSIAADTQAFTGLENEASYYAEWTLTLTNGATYTGTTASKTTT